MTSFYTYTTKLQITALVGVDVAVCLIATYLAEKTGRRFVTFSTITNTSMTQQICSQYRKNAVGNVGGRGWADDKYSLFLQQIVDRDILSLHCSHTHLISLSHLPSLHFYSTIDPHPFYLLYSHTTYTTLVQALEHNTQRESIGPGMIIPTDSYSQTSILPCVPNNGLSTNAAAPLKVNSNNATKNTMLNRTSNAISYSEKILSHGITALSI